jgi:glucose-6-phosphate isomerase
LFVSKQVSLFTLTVPAVINETAQWKRLEEHTNSVKQTHLKNLMQDRDRCFALMAEHKGILLDYSRQNMLPETMVRLWHHVLVARSLTPLSASCCRICCSILLVPLDLKRSAIRWQQVIMSTQRRTAQVGFDLLETSTSVFQAHIRVHAVMHIALRSPRDKQFFVDGENVVPDVYYVLDKVGTLYSLQANFRGGLTSWLYL